MVSVVFVGNRTSARMNRMFLGHEGGTDVITFPLGEGRLIEPSRHHRRWLARTQARAYGVRFADEVCRLVVHGTLHLFGYDDRTVALERRMKRHEDRYVGVLTGERGHGRI